MIQSISIALGAGAASALLFASVKSGVFLSIALFYLAPLPLLIVMLGWGTIAGILAAVAAAVALLATFGWTMFVAFGLGAAIPACWLGYLAMLARPSTGADPSLEWYPPGRLVAWAAILGAAMVIVAIPTFGTDDESFRAGLRASFERLLRETGEPTTGPGVGGIDTARLIDFLIVVIPPTAAVLATLTNLFNLWLAALVVRLSGRLRRPWPDLAAMEIPMSVAVLLLAAVVISFVGGLPGVAATVLTASLMMAFGILGFAVLHAITRNTGGRAFILSGTYAATIVFGWPMLGMTLLGLGETIFSFRSRLARRRGPPTLL